MVFRYRPDADLVEHVPKTRRIMPLMMPTRNESVVYFDMDIDADGIDARIADLRVQGVQASVLHIVAVAATRVLTERPRLNRFVAGGRHWQRRGIWFSFSGKKRKEASAPMSVIKRELKGDATDLEIVQALDGGVREVRSEQKNRTDKELDLLFLMPTFLLGWLVGLVRKLDHWGMLPRWYVDGDPMFASIFVANLGSLGMDAAVHHLYEYGNIPLFCVIGKKKDAFYVDDAGVVRARSVYPLRFSFDERIEDGFYCLGALERLRELLSARSSTPAVTTATTTTV